MLNTMHEGERFTVKTLGKSVIHFQMTGRAMIRPANSDKWKAPIYIIQ